MEVNRKQYGKWIWIMRIWLTISMIPLIAKDRMPCYPYITGDAFRAFADYIYDDEENTLRGGLIKDGDVIFVKGELLKEFFRDCHPQIEHRYILLTHNSDVDIPGPYKAFLEEEKLIAWFGQNVDAYEHPKLIPVPIGLTNRYNPLGNPQAITLAIRKGKKNDNRPILAYFNVVLTTNLKERKTLYEYLCHQSFCTSIIDIIPFDEYLTNISKSRFVISPRGNGLDCHRTWEALYLGAIPVVKKSAMDSVFDQLPVLIVNSWDEVTEEFLQRKHQEFLKKEYNFSKLYIDFWLELIQSYKGI